MGGKCLNQQEIGAVLLAGPDHPQHRHLQECPRCRATRAMYESFLRGNEELADQDREERLAAIMSQLILNGDSAGGINGDSAGGSGQAPRSRKNWLVPGTMLALAAVLAVSPQSLELWKTTSPSLLWRVTALAGGRVVTRSAPQALIFTENSPHLSR